MLVETTACENKSHVNVISIVCTPSVTEPFVPETRDGENKRRTVCLKLAKVFAASYQLGSGCSRFTKMVASRELLGVFIIMNLIINFLKKLFLFVNFSSKTFSCVFPRT